MSVRVVRPRVVWSACVRVRVRRGGVAAWRPCVHPIVSCVGAYMCVRVVSVFVFSRAEPYPTCEAQRSEG